MMGREPVSDPLDAALGRLHATDPEFDGGLTNHGPMAAEALLALGAPHRIGPFVDRYTTRLVPMPSADPLTSDWRDARGKPEARAALIQTFDRMLQQADPREVVARALPELLDGVMAGAFHGLLRVGHGWRAWSLDPSEPRRIELAHGLGYWTARHQRLPGDPGARAERGKGPMAALAEVPFIDPSLRRGGLIFDRFGVLVGHDAFARAVETFDPEALPPDEALDQLVLASARGYLASTGGPRFVYLHGVTGTAALRVLLPLLSPEDRVRAVAHQFAAIAAVHATHGEPGQDPGPIETPSLLPDALAERAAKSDDDHTIKLVEACLREHGRLGDPTLLAVAAHRVTAEQG